MDLEPISTNISAIIHYSKNPEYEISWILLHRATLLVKKKGQCLVLLTNFSNKLIVYVFTIS